MTERTRIAAPGLAGGEAGEAGAVSINGASVDTHQQHLLARGDVVELRTPGGGGYGDVARRDARANARDRLLGYVDDRSG